MTSYLYLAIHKPPFMKCTQELEVSACRRFDWWWRVVGFGLNQLNICCLLLDLSVGWARNFMLVEQLSARKTSAHTRACPLSNYRVYACASGIMLLCSCLQCTPAYPFIIWRLSVSVVTSAGALWPSRTLRETSSFLADVGMLPRFD